MTSITVLDPTSRPAAASLAAADRLDTLDGKVVGLLDISKPRGDVFLNEVERQLQERGAEVRRFTKPTFTKPAPPDLRHEIAQQCDAAIEALAD